MIDADNDKVLISPSCQVLLFFFLIQYNSLILCWLIHALISSSALRRRLASSTKLIHAWCYISFATTCILLLLTCVKSILTKLSYKCLHSTAACILLLLLYVCILLLQHALSCWTCMHCLESLLIVDLCHLKLQGVCTLYVNWCNMMDENSCDIYDIRLKNEIFIWCAAEISSYMGHIYGLYIWNSALYMGWMWCRVGWKG